MLPELVLELANGFSLRCGGVVASGEYVRIASPDGVELAYWDHQEWADQPAQTMTAIIQAAIVAPLLSEGNE